MRNLLTVLLTVVTITIAQGQGYKITVKFDDWKDTSVYMAYHYGNKQYLSDTIQLNSKGVGVFSGKEKKPQGMYMIVDPAKTYFEIIIGEDQEFAIETKGPNYTTNAKISGSTENSLFFENIQWVNEQKLAYEELQKQLEDVEEGSEEYNTIKSAMTKIDEAVKESRTAFVADHPESFYATIIKATTPLDVPDYPRDAEGNVTDSSAPYHWYRAHYWDNIDLNDDRLAFTPLFHPKLKTYFTETVPRHPDTVIAEADKFLAKLNNSPELFKYSLAWLLNEHAKNEIMGLDKVYVHLADEYYATGKAYWTDEKQLKIILKDADRLRPLMIGEPAPKVILPGMDGKLYDIYAGKAPVSVLYFYDSDCGLCQKSIPKAHKFYGEFKDKGVVFYAIAIDLLPNKAEDFIKEKDFLDWINIVDPTDASKFREKYDVHSTPLIYVLDKDKKILAKRISSEQLSDIVGRYLKQLNQDKKGQ